jgi:hypothetical protein
VDRDYPVAPAKRLFLIESTTGSGGGIVSETKAAGANWSGPPLIPGASRELEPRDAMQLMIRLCAELPRAAELCSRYLVEAVRVRELGCIRDAMLVEFQAVPVDKGRPGIGAFIYRPGLFDLLDGRSDILHGIAYEDALVLTSESEALEYAMLFCAATEGSEGCFFPMRPGLDFAEDPSSPELAQSRAAVLRAPEVRRKDGGWQVDLALTYSTAFFRSVLRLHPFGQVEMIDDEPLYGIEAKSRQSWQQGLRVTLPAEETVNAE